MKEEELVYRKIDGALDELDKEFEVLTSLLHLFE